MRNKRRQSDHKNLKGEINRLADEHHIDPEEIQVIRLDDTLLDDDQPVKYYLALPRPENYQPGIQEDSDDAGNNQFNYHLWRYVEWNNY